MKIKEIVPKGQSLQGYKVKTPKGVIGFWKSQWGKGVWLNTAPEESRMYPQFVDELRDCLEWEITEEDVNCHKLTSMEYIDNKTKEN